MSVLENGLHTAHACDEAFTVLRDNVEIDVVDLKSRSAHFTLLSHSTAGSRHKNRHAKDRSEWQGDKEASPDEIARQVKEDYEKGLTTPL